MTHQQNNETDKIAVIATACASAIWIYDQIKLPEGINLAMLLCIIFIASSFLYIMTIGLALSTCKTSSIRMLLYEKAQRHLFSFTIKYFWYVLLYLIYLLIMNLFSINFETANALLTLFTIIFGLLAIASLFQKPQQILNKILKRIYEVLSENNK